MHRLLRRRRVLVVLLVERLHWQLGDEGTGASVRRRFSEARPRVGEHEPIHLPARAPEGVVGLNRVAVAVFPRRLGTIIIAGGGLDGRRRRRVPEDDLRPRARVGRDVDLHGRALLQEGVDEPLAALRHRHAEAPRVGLNLLPLAEVEKDHVLDGERKFHLPREDVARQRHGQNVVHRQLLLRRKHALHALDVAAAPVLLDLQRRARVVAVRGDPRRRHGGTRPSAASTEERAGPARRRRDRALLQRLQLTHRELRPHVEVPVVGERRRPDGGDAERGDGPQRRRHGRMQHASADVAQRRRRAQRPPQQRERQRDPRHHLDLLHLPEDVVHHAAQAAREGDVRDEQQGDPDQRHDALRALHRAVAAGAAREVLIGRDDRRAHDAEQCDDQQGGHPDQRRRRRARVALQAVHEGQVDGAARDCEARLQQPQRPHAVRRDAARHEERRGHEQRVDERDLTHRGAVVQLAHQGAHSQEPAWRRLHGDHGDASTAKRVVVAPPVRHRNASAGHQDIEDYANQPVQRVHVRVALPVHRGAVRRRCRCRHSREPVRAPGQSQAARAAAPPGAQRALAAANQSIFVWSTRCGARRGPTPATGAGRRAEGGRSVLPQRRA
mmetsp:Transcript_17634/g.62076  ORF Transcript_17634/g.62076 Transcript_17634/m.62076 type:complete len:612 (-) Transcript_17634:282-2117(-)